METVGAGCTFSSGGVVVFFCPPCITRFSDFAWSIVPSGSPRISKWLMILVQIDFKFSNADWRTVIAFLLACRLSSTSESFVEAVV